MRKIVFGALILAMPLAAAAEAESFAFDPPHTFPHFALDYAGYATIYGRFDKTAGRFTIDRAAKTAALELAVETVSVTTGDNERGSRARTRDEHLRTADFFNVAEFPRMTYKSTHVKFNGEDPAEIEGQLTLLGVTRPLTLKVDRWACKVHPFYKKFGCGGNASGVLKRSEFGMKIFLPVLGDEVRITIMFLGMKQ